MHTPFTSYHKNDSDNLGVIVFNIVLRTLRDVFGDSKVSAVYEICFQ